MPASRSARQPRRCAFKSSISAVSSVLAASNSGSCITNRLPSLVLAHRSGVPEQGGDLPVHVEYEFLVGTLDDLVLPGRIERDARLVGLRHADAQSVARQLPRAAGD